MKSEIQNYSEPVVTVFKLVGRQEPKNPGEGHGQTRFDLLIQPLMVREESDALADDFSDIHPVRSRAWRENV